MYKFNINFSFLILILISVFACSPKQGTRYTSYRTNIAPYGHSKKNENDIPKVIVKNKISKKENDQISIRNQIVNTAMLQLGKPYKPAGKTAETGFDCSGFTGFVFRSNGIHLTGASHDQARQGIQKPVEDLQPGDLVFFGHGSKVTHVAIISSFSSLSECEVIHATTSAGVKKDLIWKSEYWRSRFLFGVDIIENNTSLTLQNHD